MNSIRAFLFRPLGMLPYPIICWALHGGLPSTERIAHWEPLDYFSQRRERMAQRKLEYVSVRHHRGSEGNVAFVKQNSLHGRVAKELQPSFSLSPLNLCIVPYSYPGHTLLVISLASKQVYLVSFFFLANIAKTNLSVLLSNYINIY